MPDDFSLEGQGARFPRTRVSAVARVGSEDPAERARSFDVLVRAYFAPVYKHLRLKWKQDPEQARDTTQGFFARAFEKRYFADYEPARARFRTYLRTCLDRFVMENRRGELRQKRGGQLLHLSLDFEPAEAELGMLESSSQTDPEARFDAEWTRSLLGAALAELSQQCGAQGKQLQLKVFKRYVLDNELGATGADEATRRRDVSYAAIAEELGLKVSDVTNHLAWARRELRRILLDKLAELAPSEEELESEARALFGATP